MIYTLEKNEWRSKIRYIEVVNIRLLENLEEQLKTFPKNHNKNDRKDITFFVPDWLLALTNINSFFSAKEPTTPKSYMTLSKVSHFLSPEQGFKLQRACF